MVCPLLYRKQLVNVIMQYYIWNTDRCFYYTWS